MYRGASWRGGCWDLEVPSGCLSCLDDLLGECLGISKETTVMHSFILHPLFLPFPSPGPASPPLCPHTSVPLARPRGAPPHFPCRCSAARGQPPEVLAGNNPGSQRRGRKHPVWSEGPPPAPPWGPSPAAEMSPVRRHSNSGS